jgi:uncharacterized membrane protein YvlD (DUF360 family)
MRSLLFLDHLYPYKLLFYFLFFFLSFLFILSHFLLSLRACLHLPFRVDSFVAAQLSAVIQTVLSIILRLSPKAAAILFKGS